METNERNHSIKLPGAVEVFANLKNAQKFAIDIGLSLTKIAYYSTISYRKALYEDTGLGNTGERTYKVHEGNRLHFVKFETRYLENCLDFVKKNLVNVEKFHGKNIKVTGGGAYKFNFMLQEKLGLIIDKEDEIACLIKGCNFLLKNISYEAFEFERYGNPEYKFQKAGPNIFPYMLVNIGSGVSILKVESDEVFERVGGTATGGGTFWGLGFLLTKKKGFDELLQLAERGDHRNVDMLVKDIYGGDYSSQGLSGNLIAASFGKATFYNSDGQPKYSEADLVRSLLITISNDIGQIASLHATMHNMNKVYFGGYFLRNHPLSMHTISCSIKYWSRGKVKPLFLRHEGYLGAIGAFLYGAEQSNEYNWLENYAGSSGFKDTACTNLGIKIDQLEIDQAETAVTFCPLLKDPASYNPDTTDLAEDKEARDYWLQCFEESVDKFIARALHSQPHSPTAKDRATKLKKKYVDRLHYLHLEPFAYGTLTVRVLLDTIEHCMKEFDFPDPYLFQKKKENEEALKYLKSRIITIDKLEEVEKIKALILGVLSGNMFDWGAQAVATLMETTDFGFAEAQAKIPSRPWLVDNLDDWIERLETGKPHKCAAIFVDNSGVDIILGILPFARDLLLRGTKVILCANSMPALNDVTYSELVVTLRDASNICKVIRHALKENRLIPMETAQAGPCLDLSRLNLDLCLAMVKHNVDLIVLEGMGRTLHTNFHAKMTCECLKLAVVKNRWLARRLGGDMYAVICKYEKPIKMKIQDIKIEKECPVECVENKIDICTCDIKE
ncbi:pantothenate kinase 4 [Apis mellifera caucasica]|uniref:4'-phosphopantetheine phosphatase n=1 Tax=Apis mellifera TaxID=7460 RepID=A0A7M7M0V8_APIME|nr:pantothenate kinase 4 [Apis mellifera]XP_016769404.1 pantothenate kinase 4 [Apis mellifera]KAG6801295.1 pantothenate kinase 4 [Apis mellifera caucasica]KAG9431257.1 pantothenate kinase 4 [Apis mellifera carnica]|eukprot:XP_016769403.1 pantothenate kinase 4 [Apis mellifera]